MNIKKKKLRFYKLKLNMNNNHKTSIKDFKRKIKKKIGKVTASIK